MYLKFLTTKVMEAFGYGLAGAIAWFFPFAIALLLTMWCEFVGTGQVSDYLLPFSRVYAATALLVFLVLFGVSIWRSIRDDCREWRKTRGSEEPVIPWRRK